MQLHGSITPKMIVPIIGVGIWATIITLLSEKVDGVNLGIESVLLTVTGFVVGMGLSFRSSSAYERYAEGRRYWSQLILASQSLGRAFWVHAQERPGSVKADMLGKLYVYSNPLSQWIIFGRQTNNSFCSTAMNLVVAFSVSLKHKLRFEPYTHYDDIVDLVDHIDTLAKEATQEDVMGLNKQGFFHTIGSHLGLSFATSNPRKALKRSKRPLGNLPLEILCYLSAYVDELVANGQLPVGMQQTAVCK
jgi:ion channel-forming bestrophin family protein